MDQIQNSFPNSAPSLTFQPMDNFNNGGYQALEQSGARVVDQITGVGFGVTILIIALGLSLLGNYLQFRRNNSLVDQLLTMLPTFTNQLNLAVENFKKVLSDGKN